ncbi:MAG: hypothetical protein WKF37_16935 [Bryobacteraceae bacterium]
MTRSLLLLGSALVAGSCNEPALPETKVIIGAILLDGKNPPLPHSVVIIQNGTVTASGSQQTVPIPAGSEKINAAGKFLVSAQRASAIVPGAPANLLLLNADPTTNPANYEKIDRRMINGRWVKP